MNDNPTPAGSGTGSPPAGGGAGPKAKSVLGLTFRDVSRTVSLVGLAGLTIALIIWGLFGETSILDRLKDADFARGLITFIVAVGTILIALLLTVSNILGEENPADENTAGKERFNRGKEILTILVGILGTIIGFYYGSSETKTVEEIHIASPQLTPQEPQLGIPFTLSTHVTGGKPLYTYVITFDDKAMEKKEGSSKNGWIKADYKFPEKIENGQSLTYEISVTDSKGTIATEENEILFPPPAGESSSTPQEAQDNSSS